ncbi:MAG: hypothetical protein Q9M92_08870 [Enterobacterales bacterium]|nr:hypothetical protein [Enterobacterales bacterium]
MKAILFILVLLLTSGDSWANEQSSTSQKKHETGAGEVFNPVKDVQLAINETLTKASENNRLGLIILGANWCHDSRGLAANIESTEIKTYIEQNYQLLYVDVGYLDQIKPAITHLSVPVIYATPTVLIVEPSSLEILNRDNMNLWRDAAKVSKQQVLDYFTGYVDVQKTVDPLIDRQKLSSLNKKIQKFERRLARRLYQGFAMISPLLSDRVAGKEVKGFEQSWKAFSAFRYQVSSDVEQLRKQAIAIASSKSETKSLVFPEYEQQSWE